MRPQSINVLFGALVLAALLLAGCQPQAPAVTRTPAPTRTPSRSATPPAVTINAPPAPSSVQASMAELSQKCSEVKQAPVPANRAARKLEPLSGAVVIEGATNAFLEVNFFTAPFFYARSLDKLVTLVCIYQTSKLKFTYLGGGVEARQLFWQLKLVDWKSGAVLEEFSLDGDEPPKTTVVQKGTTVIYGVRPDDKLAKILLERMGPLPRTFSGTRTFAFTSDRKKLLVIPLDQKVSPLKLVDLATWAVQEIALPPELGNITEAVFSPDANRLAVTDTDTPVEPAVTSVYDLTQKKIIRQVKLTKEQKAASATRFSPDGRQLWRGFCAWEIDGSGDECTVLMETKDRPLFLSQDGKLGFVLSGTGSSTAYQVWDTARKSQVLSIPLSGVEVRGFSADTTLLALTRGQYAEIWSIREARPLVRLKMPEGCGNTNTNLAFTPDGSRIALSCRSDLWLVDWRSGAVVQEFVGHTDRLGLGFGLGEGSKVVLIARELSGFMKAWDVQP